MRTIINFIQRCISKITHIIQMCRTSFSHFIKRLRRTTLYFCIFFVFHSDQFFLHSFYIFRLSFSFVAFIASSMKLPLISCFMYEFVRKVNDERILCVRLKYAHPQTLNWLHSIESKWINESLLVYGFKYCDTGWTQMQTQQKFIQLHTFSS